MQNKRKKEEWAKEAHFSGLVTHQLKTANTKYKHPEVKYVGVYGWASQHALVWNASL